MTDLIQPLLQLDGKLFIFINVALSGPFLDSIMVWITTKQNWYLPGALLWGLLMWKGGKRGRTMGVLLLLAIILADQISSSFLKPAIGRLRPCKELEGFRLLVHCGSWNGFPSSHASNIAAIGGLFMLSYRRWATVWIVLIFLIGISRVYVGVHYPLDVVCGWILGGGISFALYSSINRTRYAIRSDR